MFLSLLRYDYSKYIKPITNRRECYMCVHNRICMHTPTCSRVKCVQWFWRCVPIAPTCSLVYGSVVFCISHSRCLQLPPPPFCRHMYLSAPMQQAKHDSQASGWCQVLIWAMTTKALLCVRLSGALLIGPLPPHSAMCCV